jgi:hypothetical protein
MSLHSLETYDLLILDRPSACTRSSTRPVETPPIQASWITAISAFYETFRASQERREVTALPQLWDPQLKRSQAGVEHAFPVTIAPGHALTTAPVTPSANHPRLLPSAAVAPSATARRKSPSPAFSGNFG